MEHDATILDLQTSNMRLEEQLQQANKRIKELELGIAELRMRVYEKGSNPAWHRRTLGRHSSEWPMLWAAIHKLID